MMLQLLISLGYSSTDQSGDIARTNNLWHPEKGN
jgi:hypothetical protein